MIIVKRHKSEDGRLLGYTIKDNSTVSFVDYEKAIALSPFIENAVLQKNNVYRAKSGNTIETVVEYTNSNKKVRGTNLPALKKNINPKKANNISSLDYYDKDFISICRKIRKYAYSNNIVIDTTPHKSNIGRNTHLFDLIKLCDINLKVFIKRYLSVIQPYSLSKFQAKKSPSDQIWLCDIGYNTSLVIKINESDKTKPVVVSFHESNISSRFIRGNKNFMDKPCAVLVDKVTELPLGYGVDYTVQRGFITYTIHSATQSYNNGVALVKYSDIKTLVDDTLDNIFSELQSTYYDGEDNDITTLSVKRKDSDKVYFMSLGFTTVNNFCYLIDLFSQYTDKKSRLAIVEIIENIIAEIPRDRFKCIQEALKKRYLQNSTNGLYKLIVNTDEDK